MVDHVADTGARPVVCQIGVTRAGVLRRGRAHCNGIDGIDGCAADPHRDYVAVGHSYGARAPAGVRLAVREHGDLVVLVHSGRRDRHLLRAIGNGERVAGRLAGKGGGERARAAPQAPERHVRAAPVAADVCAPVAGILHAHHVAVRYGGAVHACVREPVVQCAHPAAHCGVRTVQTGDAREIIAVGAGRDGQRFAGLSGGRLQRVHHGHAVRPRDRLVKERAGPRGGNAIHRLGERLVLSDDPNRAAVLRKSGARQQRHDQEQRQQNADSAFFHVLTSSLCLAGKRPSAGTEGAARRLPARADAKKSAADGQRTSAGALSAPAKNTQFPVPAETQAAPRYSD